MMTVEIVKRMKVKKIDLDKADVAKREVCSRDEVMHACRNERFVNFNEELQGEQVPLSVMINVFTSSFSFSFEYLIVVYNKCYFRHRLSRQRSGEKGIVFGGVRESVPVRVVTIKLLIGNRCSLVESINQSINHFICST